MAEGEPVYLTPSQVAKRYQVDPTTVRRWITKGHLRATRLPGTGPGERCRYRIETADLENVLQIVNPDL